MSDYLDKWPLEKARLEFARDGRVVDVAADVPGKGWVMLWHDDAGHSVSYVSQGSAGTGGAMALPEALKEFKEGLDALLFGLGKG